MFTFFLTYEFHDLTSADHGDGLPWSFLSDSGSLGVYSVKTVDFRSSTQSVNAPLLVLVEFVYAT